MTEENNKIEITQYSSTPYDDVYRTMLNDCPGLIIPIVNELFGKKHKIEKEITVLNNELFFNRQDGRQIERITDSNFRIEDSRYLLECQSSRDGTILMRLFEYSSQIAVQDSELLAHELHVKFPNTGLIYLRNNRNTSDTMRITISVPEDECSYTVPVMKVQYYSVDEIFEKRLYFLIPFHIFMYEHDFVQYDSDEEKLKELKHIYIGIMNRLNQEAEVGNITEYIKRTIIDMSKKVLDHISKNYINVKEGVNEIMGGQILDYEAKDILNRGIAVGIEKGLLELISKKLVKGHSIPQIADALEETEEYIQQLIKEYNLI